MSDRLPIDRDSPKPRAEERRLPFAGASNFRDLGGYPADRGRSVRWGALYRSDCLDRLTDPDLELFSTLEISLVCDLRTPRECEERPDRLPSAARPRQVSTPVEVSAGEQAWAAMKADPPDLDRVRDAVAGGYREFARDHRDAWRALLGHILEAPPGAVLVHCTAGQDRTGFAIAVLLLAIGVPRDVVIADYMLTKQYYNARPEMKKMAEGLVAEGAATIPLARLEEMWRVGPDFLTAALDEMQRDHASIGAYLERALGLDDTARRALRERLLD